MPQVFGRGSLLISVDFVCTWEIERKKGRNIGEYLIENIQKFTDLMMCLIPKSQ